jgi:hypothetical protein
MDEINWIELGWGSRKEPRLGHRNQSTWKMNNFLHTTSLQPYTFPNLAHFEPEDRCSTFLRNTGTQWPDYNKMCHEATVMCLKHLWCVTCTDHYVIVRNFILEILLNSEHFSSIRYNLPSKMFQAKSIFAAIKTSNLALILLSLNIQQMIYSFI